MNEDVKITYGSDNIFRDLGLEDADELFARSQLGIHVLQLLTQKKLKHTRRSTVAKEAQACKKIYGSKAAWAITTRDDASATSTF